MRAKWANKNGGEYFPVYGKSPTMSTPRILSNLFYLMMMGSKHVLGKLECYFRMFGIICINIKQMFVYTFV